MPLDATSKKLIWFADNVNLLLISENIEPPESRKSLEYVFSFICLDPLGRVTKKSKPKLLIYLSNSKEKSVCMPCKRHLFSV